MFNQSQLRKQAIEAAKNQDWEVAISVNKAILESDPINNGALNRVGVAYLQLGKKKQAKEYFAKSLELDPSDVLAQKNLQRLKANQTNNMPSFTTNHFIEEPGTTKTIELCRLAGKKTLSELSVGQACTFKPKNRFISIEVDGQYVGALPEDISFRLTKLMQSGNTYSCSIRSCSYASCTVHIRETHRSEKNSDTHSFPISGKAHRSDDDDERLIESAERNIRADDEETPIVKDDSGDDDVD
ncbi:MAG: tetratricopeptide repeat protein [Pseudomonadales bacterium]|nr:tetratricopeptide repeat protein [Candidatus Woesebacteria bacterium]MCB9802330.1 tetratricopeptide repeat protein [Pseudomonadales bacterium]